MNDFRTWYDNLNKPAWTPETSVIGTVWSVLYPVIFVVNFYVWSLYLSKQISLWVLMPFVINLVANLAFTPVQFGLRSLWGAAAVIIIIWATTLWSMIAIYPHNKWLAIAFFPYLVWVTIASVLQLSITLRN